MSCRPVGVPRAQREHGQQTGNRPGLQGSGAFPQDPGIRESLLLSQRQEPAMETKNSGHETEFASGWDLPQSRDFRTGQQEAHLRSAWSCVIDVPSSL